MNHLWPSFLEELAFIKVASAGVAPEGDPPTPHSNAPLYKAIARSALAGGLGYGVGTAAGSLLNRTLMRPALSSLSPTQLNVLSHALGAAVSGASMAFWHLAERHQQEAGNTEPSSGHNPSV